MDLLDQFDIAAGNLRDALQHEISLRDKPGHSLAKSDYQKALDKLHTVLDEIEAQSKS